ncbi:hypothetical protein [Sinosporangium album]|uniref:hypothetical protein n=1 Tax=Sinosporangium album TaxID=504805 RepID=UPI00115FE914|nr:hypothetical protein [Sinosporangium album]
MVFGVVVAAGMALGVPAEAGAFSMPEALFTANADDTVRFTWADACEKNTFTAPCGPWKMTLRSGKVVKLADVRVIAKDAKGTSVKYWPAPTAVSGDGRFIHYFREADDTMVVRNVATGAVEALPDAVAKPPKGLGMMDIDPRLSPNGRYLVLDYGDDRGDQKGTRPSVLVDLERGTHAEIPAAYEILGFGPDGSRLLVNRFTSKGAAEFAVFGADGRKQVSRMVPREVASNGPVALAEDGATVALVVGYSRAGAKTGLRHYNLSTGVFSSAVKLGYPRQEHPHSLYFDASGNLTLWTRLSTGDRAFAGAARYAVDPRNGDTRKKDSFGIPDKAGDSWLQLPGE